MPPPLRILALLLVLSLPALAAPAHAAPPTVDVFEQVVHTDHFRMQWDLDNPDILSGLVFKDRDPYRDLSPEDYSLREFFAQDLWGTSESGAIDVFEYTEIEWHAAQPAPGVITVFTRTRSEDHPAVETRWWFVGDARWFIVERKICFSDTSYVGAYQDFVPRLAFLDTYRAVRYRDTNGALQQRGWCATPCVTQGWDGRWLQTVGWKLGRGQSMAQIYPASVPAGQPFVRGTGPNAYAGWAAPLWDSLAYTTDVTHRVMLAFSTQPDSVRELDSLWTVFNSPAFTLDAPAPPEPPRLQLSVGPNPSRGIATLTWSLPRAQHARLEVLDVSGRRVATLHDGLAPAGTMRVEWNGRATGGSAPVAPGLYWARLATPDGVRTKTLVRVR